MVSPEDLALGLRRTPGTYDGIERAPRPIHDSEGALPASPPPPRVDPLLQFFDYFHLPPQLQAISMTFWEVAHNLVVQVPRNPQRDLALQRLIEAKDAAVRAVLYKG